MLSIPSRAVRDRALGALDALGPSTALADDERRLVGDYLLSQLPADEEAAARELLARSPAAREWALGLTPALEPMAVDPLPRIPVASRVPATEAAAAGAEGAERPSSRRGGIVVIGLAVAVIIAAVVVLLVTRHHTPSRGNLAAARQPASSSSSSTSSTGATTSTTSGAVKYLAQINLRPVASGSKAVGIAEILEQQGVREIAIIGQHIPPNTKTNSYEVWLYSSPTHFEKLGFVSPAVGKAGTFSDARKLPAGASGYRELIVTTETAEKPTHPGPVLLRGAITGPS